MRHPASSPGIVPRLKQPQQRWGNLPRVLTAPQDFIAVLETAFAPDAMFETSVDPAGTVCRLTKELIEHKAIHIMMWGPEFIDGNLHLRLRSLPSRINFDITVRPEGDSEIHESSVQP